MRQTYRAENGRPGAGRRKHGADGADAVIEVPPGTVITNLETGETLADLVDSDDRAVLLRGGRGGKGNHHFRTSRNQAPRFSQPGEEGSELHLKVEMRVIADVGFVGLPNIGKTTLLTVLTAARPKIGNYPFTTIIPNLGVMAYHDTSVVLADIPGIIAGAHEGAGLGLQFLRHIERTRVLAITVDAISPEPAADIELVRSELGAYSPALLERDWLVVATRMDRAMAGEGDPAAVDNLLSQMGEKGIEVHRVSAMTGYGLEELRVRLVERTATGDDAA